MKLFPLTLAAVIGMVATTPAFCESLVYEGTEGIGKGKHIVFVANDHEYRSEQTCPALAKILAKHHGFRCTVLFGVDADGHIKAGAADLPGLEALKDADLLFFFARFMNLKDEQAQHIVDYFERGGPAVGVRTTTHCFNGQKGTWAKLNFNHKGDDYHGGLGKQVFGNTWEKTKGQSHYGSNHQMGCRITAVDTAKTHPILQGVKSIHAYSGAYKSQPPEDADPLLQVQVLSTFHESDDIHPDRPIVNAGWTRDSYVAPSGEKKKARVVYTSFGASEDLLDEDARRFLTNACLWAGGWENQIKPDLEVGIVGEFVPSAYTNGMYYGKVKPMDLAGFNSRIMPADSKLTGANDPKFARRAASILKNRPELRKALGKMYPDRFGPGVDLTPKKKPKKVKK
ncbi:ThuA domain-containing protein [bacterium]|nr:ThuA domain-containing protein [bacterium]